MKWFPSFGFQRRKRELQEELDAHLQMAIADRVARGQSPSEAKTSALRELGSVPMIADVTREQWCGLRLEFLVQDIRFALRQLRRTPGFTVTVLLTLALGIGANSAIFTLVNAILLRNLPVTDPKNLIRIGDRNDCCISDQWSDTGDY